MSRSARRSGTALAALFLVAGPAVAQNVVPGGGLYVAVPSPIDDAAYTRIKNRVEQATPRPSVVVFDFNPADKDAATPGYGVPMELADYIAGLHDIRTVAYVHHKATGHTVLPVLACKEVVCGPQGALGAVVGPTDPPLAQGALHAYDRIPRQVRPAYLAVATKMYDPGVQLRKGKKGAADWYVDLRHRQDAEKEGVQVTDTAPLPDAPDGRVGLFTAAQLRDLGFSRATFSTQQDLLDALGLTAAALREDPLAGRAPVAFRYVLKGAVDGGKKEEVVRMAEGVLARDGNLLFLQLECTGGDLQAARELAQKLTDLQTDRGLTTVAFVPDRAPDTAAIVALGCTDIVMSKRTDAAGGADSAEAEFGDFEAVLGKPGTNADLLAASLHELAVAKGYPPVLIDGMLDRDIVIVRAQKRENANVHRLMTEAEFEGQKAEGKWVNAVGIKPRGQLLKLTATEARNLGLARFVVDTRDPAEVYARYGVDPAQVKDASPAWLDQFAAFLKLPAVTVLLVVIGFTGLILELKVPGTTVPGIVAALCFILVFWAHTQFSNQVAVLAGLLFILGLVLVLVEVFVLPGIGAAGVTGVLLMLASLGLVTFGGNEIPQTAAEWGRIGGKMAQYLVGMIASFGLALLIARYLPNIPYANRLMLVPPGEKPGAEAEPPVLPGAALAASLLGAVGTAVTVLRPAGTVHFGDQYVDVVTEGGYIPAGARVQVVEVEGTRIVVKEV
ncbi:MAG TPA: NfeD family protein [Fimbriiglobus sp.]|nr:NfeD family protein [Fimbriiglobus sp.]